MKNFLLTRILVFIGGKLSGYKTYIGGAGGVLYGILGLMAIAEPKAGIPVNVDAQTAIGLITGGIAAIGIGHKGQKLITAIQAASQPPVPVPDSPENQGPAK